MVPAADTKNQIGIGDLQWINNGAQPLETVSTIAACFCHSALVDLVQTGQNDVVLTVGFGILVVAICVFAGVNLF